MFKVSIIIPTFNRADSLALTIESLVRQTLGPQYYEILIVDNGSSDHTRLVAKEAAANNPRHHFRYVYEPEPGLLSGRHRGAQEARGEVLTYIDDDIDADREWLGAIAETFKDPGVQLAGGRNLPEYEVQPPDWLEWFWVTTSDGGRYCGELSLSDLGEQMRDIDANHVWGLNFSIRRKALFDLDGFHPDTMPKHLQHLQGDGETGLTIKANLRGYRTVYQPKAIVHHRIPAGRLTAEYFVRRYHFQGVCDSYTQLRREFEKNLADAREGSAETKARTARLHRYMRHPLHSGRNFVRRLLHGTSNGASSKPVENPSPDFVQIKDRIGISYQEGYRFHQEAVRDNPELMAWVLRTNYWDYKLPDIPAPRQGPSLGQSQDIQLEPQTSSSGKVDFY